MSLSPKHQILASAIFFSILSGVVRAPIAPMTVLLAVPVVANLASQLVEAREPFVRFARGIKRAIVRTRSDLQRAGAAERPGTVRFLEPDRAAIVFEQLATQRDKHGAFPGQSVI